MFCLSENNIYHLYTQGKEIQRKHPMQAVLYKTNKPKS